MSHLPNHNFTLFFSTRDTGEQIGAATPSELYYNKVLNGIGSFSATIPRGVSHVLDGLDELVQVHVVTPLKEGAGSEALFSGWVTSVAMDRDEYQISGYSWEWFLTKRTFHNRRFSGYALDDIHRVIDEVLFVSPSFVPGNWFQRNYTSYSGGVPGDPVKVYGISERVTVWQAVQDILEASPVHVWLYEYLNTQTGGDGSVRVAPAYGVKRAYGRPTISGSEGAYNFDTDGVVDYSILSDRSSFANRIYVTQSEGAGSKEVTRVDAAAGTVPFVAMESAPISSKNTNLAAFGDVRLDVLTTPKVGYSVTVPQMEGAEIVKLLQPGVVYGSNLAATDFVEPERLVLTGLTVDVSDEGVTAQASLVPESSLYFTISGNAPGLM